MIEAIYKCTCCNERKVDIPERPVDGDIALWMNVLQAMIAMDHQSKSPKCTSNTMTYVKLPVDEGAPGIGMRRPLQ